MLVYHGNDYSSGHFETDVVPGTVFYSWVFGFGGKVVINGPAEVKEQYKEMVLKAAGPFIGAEKS